MTDEQLRKLADEVWKDISSAHLRGDGFAYVYHALYSALREAASKGKL